MRPTIVDDEIAALVIPAFAQTFAERRRDVRTGLRRARLEEPDDRSDRLLCGPLARTTVSDDKAATPPSAATNSRRRRQILISPSRRPWGALPRQHSTAEGRSPRSRSLPRTRPGGQARARQGLCRYAGVSAVRDQHNLDQSEGPWHAPTLDQCASSRTAAPLLSRPLEIGSKVS